MRRILVIFGFAFLVLSCTGILLHRTTSTHAKSRWFTNWDLRGSFATQLSGTIAVPTNAGFPAALTALNGPYCLTGRVEADGMGNVQGTVWDNYSGLPIHYSFQGTYQVNDDGTLTIKALLPLSGGINYPLTMFGVMCADGNQVRLTQIGATMAELGIPNLPAEYKGFVGAVVTGSWVRQ
jgi:hypothetical protein